MYLEGVIDLSIILIHDRNGLKDQGYLNDSNDFFLNNYRLAK